MIKIALIGILLVLSSCQTTFVYSFTASSNSAQTKPSFSLGVLNQNDEIIFSFSTKAAAPQSGYVINIMDSTNNVISPAPVSFPSTIPQ